MGEPTVDFIAQSLENDLDYRAGNPRKSKADQEAAVLQNRAVLRRAIEIGERRAQRAAIEVEPKRGA